MENVNARHEKEMTFAEELRLLYKKYCNDELHNEIDNLEGSPFYDKGDGTFNMRMFNECMKDQFLEFVHDEVSMFD